MSEAAAVSEAVSISASAARRLNAILKGEHGAALRISGRRLTPKLPNASEHGFVAEYVGVMRP